MKFFIIHGIYGHPEENWFPWLKKELEKKEYQVVVPIFPTPIGQSLENWLKVIKKYEDEINNETVFIGHSLGAAFILNYLEKSDKEVKATFLVAGYHKMLDNKFRELNKTFVDKQFNWGTIKSRCNNFFIFASDNDEYIPLKVTKELANNLDAELIIINNGGHLNKQSGYYKFTPLLDKIIQYENRYNM